MKKRKDNDAMRNKVGSKVFLILEYWPRNLLLSAVNVVWRKMEDLLMKRVICQIIERLLLIVAEWNQEKGVGGEMNRRGLMTILRLWSEKTHIGKKFMVIRRDYRQGRE